MHDAVATMSSTTLSMKMNLFHFYNAAEKCILTYFCTLLIVYYESREVFKGSLPESLDVTRGIACSQSNLAVHDHQNFDSISNKFSFFANMSSFHFLPQHVQGEKYISTS